MPVAALSCGQQGPEGARALFLLHGSPSDRRMWRLQVDELSAEGYRVITPDLRGHGQSPMPDAPWSLEDCAQDVLAMADGLGVERFVLGGLSVGAMVALAVVEAAPGRVAGLLLAATRADRDLPEEQARRHAVAARLRAAGREDVGPWVETVFAPATVASRPELVEEFGRLVEATPVEGRARLLEAVADRKDRMALLPTVRCPALIIVGTDDPITPVAKGRAIHAAMPGSFLQVVEGASHLVNMEAPGVFNRAVANWLMFAGLDP